MNQEKITPYFQHQCDMALKTAKKMNGMGEYIWAKDWEKYARDIRAYALEYQRARAFARRFGKPEPVLCLPLQPANLSTATRRGDDGGEVIFRLQCTSSDYKRPSMYQGISF